MSRTTGPLLRKQGMRQIPQVPDSRPGVLLSTAIAKGPTMTRTRVLIATIAAVLVAQQP